MDENGFWDIVQRAHDASSGDMDQKCDALRRELSALSKSDALDFAGHFDAMMGKAFSWPLWGAAYVVNGGCSDDSFTDFRSALISRGRQAYERALVNPDSLAGEDFDEEEWFYEGYQYAVTDGVEAVATCFQNLARNLGEARSTGRELVSPLPLAGSRRAKLALRSTRSAAQLRA